MPFRRDLTVLAGLLLIAGCGSPSAGDEGWVRLVLEPDDGVDVSAATHVNVRVFADGGFPVDDTFVLQDEIELPQIPFGNDRIFYIQMLDVAAPLAVGTSGPVDVIEGAHTQVVVTLR